MSDNRNVCPVDHKSSSSSSGNIDECPVMHKDSSGSKTCDHAMSIGDMPTGQQRQPGQTKMLSTTRNVSHIDKSDFTPGHQVKGVDKWVYPSEQQYYNAIKRKGYDTSVDDIGVTLAIHNTVNEQSWAQVKNWESKYTDSPKLKRFCGRPKDISPKAFIMGLFGYTRPFDRHDWIVDRNGKDIRYVIDFYKGSTPAPQPQVQKNSESNSNANIKPNTSPPPIEPAMAIYLDIRPAADSFSAVRDRFQMAMHVQYTTMRMKYPWLNILGRFGDIGSTSGKNDTGSDKK